MQKEINLLPSKNVGFLEREETILGARIIAIFSVIVVICGAITVFFLQKNYSVAALTSQQENLKSQLSLVQGKVNKQLTLVDRAKKIEAIIKKRPDMVNKISFVEKQVPSTVTIQTISVSETDMTLQVTSSSLASLQQLIDALTALINKKTFLQKLTIDNIIVNQQDGTYSVGVKGIFL